MVTPAAMLLAGPDLHCAGPLALWEYSLHLPGMYRRKPKNVLPSARGASGTVPYGKSGPGYCIVYVHKKVR